ncbi:STAS domain-containing protein [Nocardia sp. NPDC048505]|uniref:STAS domain-containing protein n=1 Tax=unclassified Nocardia TaxID=2637762 RepID=UPI0033D9F2C4
MPLTDHHRDFDIDVRTLGAAVVVMVSGEIDMVAGPHLQQSLEQAHDQAPERVVIDLSRVEFFDSTGVNTLLLVSRRTPTALRLVPSFAVTRPLDALGLKTEFELFDTVDAAVAAVDRSGGAGRGRR